MLTALSCSIECYKSHQNTHVEASSPSIERPAPTGLPPKPPPVPFLSPSNLHGEHGGSSFAANSATSFDWSPDLQLLYKRFPRLFSQLQVVYEATTEPINDQHDDHSSSRIHTDRGRGRSRGRGRGRDRSAIAPWSQQKGFKAGLHQLRKLRRLDGDDGEGLREFSKLAMRITQGNQSEIVADEV